MNALSNEPGNANVVVLFEAAAARYPESPALIDRSGPTTYDTLLTDVEATAAYFLDRGLRAGDRVLVFVPVSTELYRVLLALFKIGAVAVFIDEWAGYERLAQCCRLADCRAFVGNAKTRWLGWLLPALRRVPLHLTAAGRRRGAVVPAARLSADAPALITFTTGSTGTPKAANRTHGFLQAQLDALWPYLKPEAGRRVLVGLPVVALCYLAAGACVVLADGLQRKPHRARPDRWLARIRQWNVTELIASPYWVDRLAEYCLEARESTPLQRLFTGGAPVFPHHARRWRRAFPGTDVRVVFGSTEAEPISTVRGEVLADTSCDHGLLAGVIDAGTDVRIIPTGWHQHRVSPETFDYAALKPGHVGEIVVAGRHVLRSYWYDEGTLERTKIDTGTTLWHRTGDAGYLDSNGRLHLLGRCGQLIHRAGRIISPFVCEGRLAEIPGIALGTVLEHEGRLIVVVESKRPAAVLKPEIETALGFVFDTLRVVSQIPRDPRHFSKIDYGKLGKRYL